MVQPLFIRNARLFIRNARLFIRNARLFIRNARLFILNARLFIRNARLLGYDSVWASGALKVKLYLSGIQCIAVPMLKGIISQVR